MPSTHFWNNLHQVRSMPNDWKVNNLKVSGSMLYTYCEGTTVCIMSGRSCKQYHCDERHRSSSDGVYTTDET